MGEFPEQLSLLLQRHADPGISHGKLDPVAAVRRILREAGLTTADMRYMRWMAQLHEVIGEEGWEAFMQEAHELRERSECGQRRAAARTVLRKRLAVG